ncbi:MAG: OsmC family protein [Clostridia bacterium]|nr:OsmC family protein [Clostridia bacterium]
MRTMEVTFPGGQRVDAHAGGLTVHTDQPVKAGGDASAPTPFMTFLGSIATCAGIYALGFCQQRDIDTTDMKITMSYNVNPETKMVDQVELKLHTPEGFPAKYENAIIKSMNLCSVKKHMEIPPEFKTVTTISHP